MHLNSHSIKEQSVIGVYRAIEQSDGITRNGISADTGRSVVTVCKIVDILLQNQLVIEEKDVSSTLGRKAFQLRINHLSKTVLILDLTKKRFTARLLYLDHMDAVPRFKYNYDKEASFQSNLEAFLEESKDRLFGQNELFSTCIGVGVIVPGPYLKKRDQVINKRLRELDDVRLKEVISKVFPDQRLLIEEDVKFAGLYSVGVSEKKNKQTVFYAYIDEGVGGSVIINGRISFGAHSFAGDFGQLMFSDGRTVEEEICIPSFFESIGISNPKDTNSEILFEGIDYSDLRIRQRIRELENKVALAFYNVCWLLDPNYIIIESKYCHYFPDFTNHVSERLKELLGNISENMMPKLIGQNGSVQNAYKGAAGLILNEYLTNL